MDCRANSDLCLITDEKFDFDVSLSPASSKGDEDEVFVSPLNHKERSISANVASGPEAGFSPLTEEQFEVCREAHKVINMLQKPAQAADANSREEFLQDAEAKLGMLVQSGSTLSPIKRQTFLVQDSPMKELPPAVQRRLLRGSRTNTASSTRTASTPSIRPTHSVLSNRTASTNTTASSRTSTRLSTRLSTSSPVVVVKAQPKTGLRGKAALGVVLPSKPSGPTASATKSRVEKSRLQPPSKVGDKKPVVGSWKRSPSSRPSSRAESSEDLLSDSASVASDISDSSINSSLLGKRAVVPPSKSLKRNLSALKAPPPQTRRMTDRKNSSLSSSSMSSFNSSMSLSPDKGKPNPPLNRSLSGSTGPAPTSVSKPALPRPTRSSVYGTAAPASTSAGRRSLSTQVRKPSELERSKAMKSTPLKRAEVTPIQMTPSKRVSERTASFPSSASNTRLQSGLKTKPKPEAVVLPTPSGGFRGAPQKDDASKMMKPKRLMSTHSVDSPPQKPSAAPLTPSAGTGRSLQMKARCPSTLPTLVKRRMSAIPPATPTGLTRPSRSSTVSSSGPAPSLSVAPREKSCSPAPADAPVEQEEVEVVLQPFHLEEDEEEQPSVPTPPSPPQSDQSESSELAPEPAQSQPQPGRDLIQLETAEESIRTEEVLLLDLPAPILQPQEKLLIDLTNTPDLIRTTTKSSTSSQQLIDLTSPLIKWSPDDKRENNAPLINLSF